MGAAIARVGRAHVFSGAGGDITVPFDSGTATAGSLIIGHYAQSSGTQTLTLPTGYTVIGSSPYTDNSNRRSWLYMKKAVGGETGIPAATSDNTGSADSHAIEVSGVDADAIIAGTVDIFGALTATTIKTNQNTAGASIATATPNHVSTDDVLHLAFLTANAGIVTPTASSSFTIASTIPSSGRSFVASRVVTNPGATGTTLGWTNSAQSTALILAIPSLVVPPAAPFNFWGRPSGRH